MDILDEYEKVITDRVRDYLKRVESSDAVKYASLNDSGDIHIEFEEPVDIEGQDVMNVFIYGGVIKKADSKDNVEEQYFEIPAIGEF